MSDTSMRQKLNKAMAREKRAKEAAARVKKADADAMAVELAGNVNHEGAFLRRSSDAASLQAIEMSVRRDLEDSRRLDKAAAIVGVRLGIALQAGKSLVTHGFFETWVEKSFEDFSVRRAQYFLKLGKVFLTEWGQALELPQAGEVGTYLVKAGDGSKLGDAVTKFIAGKSLPELMEQYGIKAKAATIGGFRPSAYMLSRYIGEHQELSGIPFEQWTAEQQECFREWQNMEVAKSDGNDAMRVAAEGKWASLREGLADHGLKRKSFVYLTTKQLEETQAILALVSKELSKALKDK
jgi:hypothetical protein